MAHSLVRVRERERVQRLSARLAVACLSKDPEVWISATSQMSLDSQVRSVAWPGMLTVTRGQSPGRRTQGETQRQYHGTAGEQPKKGLKN